MASLILASSAAIRACVSVSILKFASCDAATTAGADAASTIGSAPPRPCSHGAPSRYATSAEPVAQTVSNMRMTRCRRVATQCETNRRAGRPDRRAMAACRFRWLRDNRIPASSALARPLCNNHRKAERPSHNGHGNCGSSHQSTRRNCTQSREISRKARPYAHGAWRCTKISDRPESKKIAQARPDTSRPLLIESAAMNRINSSL